MDNVIIQDSARGSWLQNVTKIQSLLESSEIKDRKGAVLSLEVLVNTCKTVDKEILKEIQIPMKELLTSLLNLLEILHSEYSGITLPGTEQMHKLHWFKVGHGHGPL